MSWDFFLFAVAVCALFWVCELLLGIREALREIAKALREKREGA